LPGEIYAGVSFSGRDTKGIIMVSRIIPLTGLLVLFAFPACAQNPSKTKGQVTTMADGLQYWDLKVGKGAEAKPGQQVKVNYTIWAAHGKKLKISETTLGGVSDIELGTGPHGAIRPVTTTNDDQPVSFPLGKVKEYQWWDEVIVGMKPGGKRQARISHDAYVIEVHLLKVSNPAPGPVRVQGPPHMKPGGLMYWDIQVGTGTEAKIGNQVVVNFTGRLNAKKFISSIGQKPYEFTLGAGQVIKGWDEGVEGMKVGGKRRLRIPASLADGAQGVNGVLIPPNAIVVFDIELLSVR
jgi:FKBP-type peptidyl-prolyl cis-trans isomerase